MSTEKVIMPKSDYVSVCATIREKTGTTEPIKSSELVEKTETVYQKGYEKGKSEVVPAKEEQEISVDITENGTIEILPDENKVLSKATVNVDVSSEDSYHQLFWDNYQCFGGRVDYEKAFYNASHTIWIADMIKPKYDFTVNIANSMFRGLTDLVDFNAFLEDRNVTFGFVLNPQNQGLAQAGYMFSGCTNLVSVIDLDLEKVSTIIYLCNGCTSLETIHLKNLQKTTNVDGSFIKCSALKNVIIEGEIGSNINFGDSPLLTYESINSIGDAVIDVTGQTSKTITLNKAVINNMTDSQKSMFTNKNWTIVSKG